MPGRVHHDLVEAYQRDGVVVLRQEATSVVLDLLASGVEHNRRHPSRWSHWYTDPSEAIGFWTDYVTWPDVEAYRRVVFESDLAAIAGELMRSGTVRFFHEHVLVKEAGADERTPWHHDSPYYCVDGLQNVSMWIPLDPVPATHGMRFIAGSHRWGRQFVPRRFVDHAPYAEPDERFELVPDLDAELDRHDVLSFDVDPGDIVCFHYRTLHDAPGNGLPTARRAVSLRWLGDDATFGTRPWQVSPPFEPNGLRVGDGLGNDARFPVVFSDRDGRRRSGRRVTRA